MSLIDSIVTSVNCERVNDAFEIIYVLLDGALPIKTGECCESKWTKNKRRTANIRPFARIFAGLWVIFFHPLSLSLTLSLFVVYSTNWKYFLWRPDHAKRRIGRVFMIFAIFSLLSHADPKWQDVICILGGHEIGGGNRRIACVYSPLFISNTLSILRWFCKEKHSTSIYYKMCIEKCLFLPSYANVWCMCDCMFPSSPLGYFPRHAAIWKSPVRSKQRTHTHMFYLRWHARVLYSALPVTVRETGKNTPKNIPYLM